MKKRITLIFIFFLYLYCGNPGQDNSLKPGKITHPKFHTAENEGYWKNKADTHLPIVTFVSNSKIKVEVPIKQTKTPRHYIEVIVLMKGKKEVAKKSFSFSFNKPVAFFTLKDPDAKDYWVVAKCNLHDMWKTKVEKP